MTKIKNIRIPAPPKLSFNWSGKLVLDKIMKDQGGYIAAASAFGVAEGTVRSWVGRGYISWEGAVIAQEKLEIPRETLRPDISPGNWQRIDELMELKKGA